MLIPPTYLHLLERPHPTGEPRARSVRPNHHRRLASLLLPAATGAAAGGLTAWLLLQRLG